MSPILSESATGQVVVDDYQEEATVSAEVLDLRGREFVANREAHTEVTTKITICWRTDVKANWRVIYGTRVFEIVAPPIDLRGRHRTAELMCKELAS